MMKLWLLRPIDKKSGPWEKWYDKLFGVVVRAETEEGARELAATEAGDESEKLFNPWLSTPLTSCEELKAEGGPGVIIVDFHSA